MRNWTHHVAGAWQNPITSCRRWQKDQTPIQKQTKYRTQQTKHRAQRCLSKKKKKIPNTQTKTKPSNPQTVTSSSLSPQRAHRRRCHNGRPSSQIDIDIVDGRSVIVSSLCRLRLCLCAGERCSLASLLPSAVRPSLKVFFSNSLSDSQSLSLSLSHWMTE